MSSKVIAENKKRSAHAPLRDEGPGYAFACFSAMSPIIGSLNFCP
jgi:hypothetical protein